MDQSKGLSALGYLSYYFAPFIVPIVLFFVTKEETVRYHAKRAFISHSIPVVLGIVFIVPFFIYAVLMDSSGQLGDKMLIILVAGSIIFAIITFILAIWNLIQAIKVLR